MVKNDSKAYFPRASPVYKKEVCNKLYKLSEHTTAFLIIVCFRLIQAQNALPARRVSCLFFWGGGGLKCRENLCEMQTE